mmetsp:Transcript_2405/g.3746  ORF Transcript_2405/g.3746 Transcript_2405/m.3746 type:complete len:146 (-) Transcript_2405:779-1216(-)
MPTGSDYVVGAKNTLVNSSSGGQDRYYVTEIVAGPMHALKKVVKCSSSCDGSPQASGSFEFSKQDGTELLKVDWKCTDMKQGYMDVFITKQDLEYLDNAHALAYEKLAKFTNSSCVDSEKIPFCPGGFRDGATGCSSFDGATCQA